MKRSLIALSVAAAILAPAAEAAPKVYGKINVTAESADRSYSGAGAAALSAVAGNVRDESRISSNASRFGIKGEDELTATTSAVYQIEWEVNTDDVGATGARADLGPRNRFLGLKHVDYGVIKIGQYDSYFKLAEGKIDQFNDLVGDLEFALAGQDRLKSVIGYESPKVANTRFNIMTQGQDAEGATSAANTNPAARGRNGISSSVVFEDEDMGLYAALAYNKGVYGKSLIASAANGLMAVGSREQDALRAVATYKVADLTLGAMFQEAKSTRSVANNLDKEQGYLVSAAYKLTDEVTLKAQFASAKRDEEIAAAAGVNKREITNIGADYNFTKKARVLAFYSELKEDGMQAANTGYTAKDKIMGIGMEHSF